MPRGVRAIHGAEVTGHHHGIGTGERNEFEMVQAEYDYLPAACWCDTTFVVTTQRDVARGVTRSCGRRACRPPGHQVGDAFVVGPILAPSSVIVAGWDVAKARKRFGEHLEGRRFVTRARPRVERPSTVRARRSSSPSIQRRRVRTVALHAAGHSARMIADRLMVPVGTVYNDLYASGVISGKRGRSNADA